MSSSVGIFSIIVILFIGLSSLDAKHGKNQKSAQTLDFKQPLYTDKGQLKPKVERSHHEGQLQTIVQRSRGIKHEQQLPTYAAETEGIKMKDRVQTSVAEKHQLLSKMQADQNLKLEVQLSTNVKKGKELKHKEQLQKSVQTSETTKLKYQIWIEMRKNQIQNVENTVPLLWKRGQGQSLSETSRPKSKKFQSNSPPYSKLKSSDQSASNIPPKSNPISKLAHFVSNSFSKTKRVLSGGAKRLSSKSEDSDKWLTSGYTTKPSGLGPIGEYPNVELSGSPLPWRPSPGRNQAVTHDVFSTVSPAKSPEVNQIWDFINRRSKNWSNLEDYSPTNKNKGLPEPVETKTLFDAQSTGLTAPYAHHDENCNSSNIKRRNAGQRGSENEVDNESRHLIKRHKRGWSTPKGLPASDASFSSSDKDLSSGKPRAAKKYSPQSPIGSPSQNLASSNAGRKFGQLSNKELDDQYNAYITRVKSRE